MFSVERAIPAMELHLSSHLNPAGFVPAVVSTAYGRVIVRLFILTSMALHHSPEYLFTTSSADVSSDSGDSWKDYILMYLNIRFTPYSLRLTMLLNIAFTLGLRLQSVFPFNSPLIHHSLLDDFAMGGILATSH